MGILRRLKAPSPARGDGDAPGAECVSGSGEGDAGGHRLGAFGGFFQRYRSKAKEELAEWKGELVVSLFV